MSPPLLLHQFRPGKHRHLGALRQIRKVRFPGTEQREIKGRGFLERQIPCIRCLTSHFQALQLLTPLFICSCLWVLWHCFYDVCQTNSASSQSKCHSLRWTLAMSCIIFLLGSCIIFQLYFVMLYFLWLNLSLFQLIKNIPISVLYYISLEKRDAVASQDNINI